jgi:DNA-damage-inducible protein D
MEEQNKLIVFQESPIRRIWHNEEWWFSIVDVVEVLTESKRPRKYWSDLKKKLQDEGFNEVSDKIGQLKMKAPDGKMRKTDAANTETMFRIIQSEVRQLIV